MIKNDKKLTSYQLVIYLLCAICGVGILQLPAGLTEAVGNEAWLLVILTGTVTLFAAFLICKAGSKFNGNSLVDASKKTFGKHLGIILLIPILLSSFIATCTETEIFSLAIRTFLIDQTPSYGILMPFLFLLMVITRGDLKNISRFFQFMVPFVSVVVVIIYLLAIPGSEFTNLLPVFQREPREYLSGMRMSMFSFLGIMSLMTIYPYIENREFKSTFKYSGISIGIMTIVYAVTNALCVAKLGVGETKWLIHPTVSLIKSAYIPGGFVERLEGVLMSLWVIIAFITLCVIVYSISIIISDIFDFRSNRHVSTIIVPFIYFISNSVVSILDIHIINRMSDLVFGTYTIIIFPILFLIVNKIRFGKKGTPNEN